MVMFIVIAIYYIIRVNRHLLSKDIFYALLFSLPILLFRTSVFYMLICVLLYILSIRLPLAKRYFYIYISLIVILASVFTYQIIEELSIQHGYTYEIVQKIIENKAKQHGRMSYILNYLASLIGPFPNLVAAEFAKQNYITLYSFSSFCKVFYSFFFIYGTYGIFKNKHYELMGVLIFWLLNTVMLDFTLFAQHDRYQWPHMPFTIILAIYGLKCWNENRHILRWDRWYLLLAFVVIIIFNFR